MTYIPKKLAGFWKNNNLGIWITFYCLIYMVLVIKLLTIKQIGDNWLFTSYSIAVSVFLLSRFILAYFHSPDEKMFDKNYEPTISFGVPAKNEEGNILETIMKIAQSDYPVSKFDIIAVNDGSTDNTLREMLKAKELAAEKGILVKVVDWEKNRGKRDGMAECVRQSDKDIIIFIDSDSFVQKDTARELVKYFFRREIAAVAGHAFVANENQNILTKMQAVRYFVSFKAFKAAESLYGNVTCCSGCCSAYRRIYVNEVLDEWLNQKFLGSKCTYGDDRSLTNFILKKGYQALFSPTAIAYTVVPSSLRVFMKQQLRWKKSWTRESFNASKFMWKKNPIMSISFYLSFILPLLAPIIVVRALIWYPLTTGNFPYFYVSGLLLISVIYGLYYNIFTKDNKWFYGAVFTIFYTLILIWQLPYAILTIRDSRWGTR
jgi:hyaluronan synthase